MGRELKEEGGGERRGGRDTPIPDWESEKVATLVGLHLRGVNRH